MNSGYKCVKFTPVPGEPWFAGRDIASALGYKEATKAVREKVDSEDRSMSKVDSPQGIQNTMIINESGLYSLILSSKLPTAKKFKKWVTSEVLPSVRKTGLYSCTGLLQPNDDPIIPMKILSPDDYLSAARLIAGCKTDRLPIILNLLNKGGWDIDIAKDTLSKSISTADVGQRIRDVMKDRNLTFPELSAITGINSQVLRSYRDGRRFPKPDRYALLVAAIENLYCGQDTDDIDI